MKNLPFVIALAVGLSFPLATFGAQTGGLPDVDARVTTLETVVTSLQALVTTLQSNVTILQTANNGLKTALDAEVNARIAADTALQNALKAEAEARQAQDVAFGFQLGFERSDRISGDDLLAEYIDAALHAAKPKTFTAPASGVTFLPNGDMTILATLNLPAGNYYLTAKVGVQTQIHDELWRCYLYLDGSQLLDRSNASTVDATLTNTNVDANIKLQRVIALPASGRVDFQCESGEAHSNVYDISFIAIEVGAPQ